MLALVVGPIGLKAGSIAAVAEPIAANYDSIADPGVAESLDNCSAADIDCMTETVRCIAVVDTVGLRIAVDLDSPDSADAKLDIL